jgi:hypothetical protein
MQARSPGVSYSVPPLSNACSGMSPSVVPGIADSTGRYLPLLMAAASKLTDSN